jgi:TonB family protein
MLKHATMCGFADSEAPLRSRILVMTTPPRAVSIAAIMSSVVLGTLLLVGVLQIPVPALRIQVELGQILPVPEEAAIRPTLLPSPTRPLLLGKLEEVVRPAPEPEPVRVAEVEMEPKTQQQPIERPSFTPMSVEPSLSNRDEVAQALIAAYPADLLAKGIGGTTILGLRVGPEGTVLHRRSIQSSGSAALDEAALLVVDRMRFSPALNRDQRVPVWVNQGVTFKPAADP